MRISEADYQQSVRVKRLALDVMSAVENSGCSPQESLRALTDIQSTLTDRLLAEADA